MVRALIKHAFATHAAHWSNAQKRSRMTKCAWHRYGRLSKSV